MFRSLGFVLLLWGCGNESGAAVPAANRSGEIADLGSTAPLDSSPASAPPRTSRDELFGLLKSVPMERPYRPLTEKERGISKVLGPDVRSRPLDRSFLERSARDQHRALSSLTDRPKLDAGTGAGGLGSARRKANAPSGAK